jgi:hypothetical protein
MSTEYKITDKVRQKVLAMSTKEIRFELAKKNNAFPSEYYDLLCNEMNKRREQDESNTQR